MSDYKLDGSWMSDLPNVAFSAGAFTYELRKSVVSPLVIDNLDAYDLLVQPGNPECVVEDREFLIIVGHSSPSGPRFINTDRDNGVAGFADLRWGGGRLRWVVVDGCYTLQGRYSQVDGSVDIFSRWGNVFAGLRAMYGFASTSDSERTRGRVFAKNLVARDPVWLAWLKACEETDNAEYALLAVNSEDAKIPVEGDAQSYGDDGKVERIAEDVPLLSADVWPDSVDRSPIDAKARGLVYFVASV